MQEYDCTALAKTAHVGFAAGHMSSWYHVRLTGCPSVSEEKPLPASTRTVRGLRACLHAANCLHVRCNAACTDVAIQAPALVPEIPQKHYQLLKYIA